ncbi:uncharacterized protein LOC111633362 isoform X2 [Centruroides sculpturatus]|uniref:uncharacterized protein LOC111633362 isoform X2 n=1 Tax=Centruroides sculpturatus TaxID=218467 RepID=UPI000C6D84DB|nr:uncharacterized protein LOC111633362 isoform X2 [Centruroides sculpturatus]
MWIRLKSRRFDGLRFGFVSTLDIYGHFCFCENFDVGDSEYIGIPEGLRLTFRQTTRWYALNTSLSWRKLHHNLQTDLIIYLVTTLFRKFYHQESSTIQEIIRNYLDYMNLHHCKSWRKLLYTIIHRLTHYLLSNNVVQKILPPGIKHNPRINSELSGLHEPTPL